MNRNIAMNRCLAAVAVGIFLFSPCASVMGQGDNLPVSAWKTGWHLDAGGGVQALFSDDVANLSLRDRLTPFVSVGVGKWILPSLGLRLQANGYSLNGFSTSEGTYLSDPLGNGLYGANDPVRDQVPIRPDGSYRHYLRYLNVQLAVEASLLGALGAGQKNHRWDIIPALGAGYLRSLGYKGTPVTDNLSVNFSLRGKYAVTSHWDVNLEVSVAAFDGNFDGRITRQRYEAYSGVMLGISYNFATPAAEKNLSNPEYVSGETDETDETDEKKSEKKSGKKGEKKGIKKKKK